MFRYVSILCLLAFLRGCDFYSTSLWFFQSEGYRSETNPLVSVFGLGWNSLVTANVIVFIIMSVLLYFYYFDKERIATIKSKSGQAYTSIWAFASDMYFDRQDRKLKLFYKFSKNKTITLAHVGYVLASTLAFASCIATTHNLLSYYQADFYIAIKAAAGHILYYYYALFIAFAFLSFRSVLKEDYRKFQLIERRT